MGQWPKVGIKLELEYIDNRRLIPYC